MSRQTEQARLHAAHELVQLLLAATDPDHDLPNEAMVMKYTDAAAQYAMCATLDILTTTGLDQAIKHPTKKGTRRDTR